MGWERPARPPECAPEGRIGRAPIRIDRDDTVSHGEPQKCIAAA